MSWLRRHWRLVLVLTLCSLGAIAVALLYAAWQKRKAKRLQSKLILATTNARVQGLKTEQAAREHELATNQALSDKIDAEIATIKMEAEAAVRSIDEMSDEEIADAFNNLGY